mmetsp:Transcript_93488/g.161967  ORF Transcript_93488/g.161967 Transcript_93488/m.161967 type:complete len:88 (-) Transcript_93488:538-801(-)
MQSFAHSRDPGYGCRSFATDDNWQLTRDDDGDATTDETSCGTPTPAEKNETNHMCPEIRKGNTTSLQLDVNADKQGYNPTGLILQGY